MSIVKGIFTHKSNADGSVENIDLDALFKEYYDRLVYFSLQLIRDKDQAEDIVQDAFIKYWNQREMVMQDKIAIKNFLYSTVRNASLNTIRHNKVVEGYIQQQGGTEPEEPPVIEAIITAEAIAEIHSAVHALPANYKTISVMGFFDGKKNHEIAEELDMSINTVKKQKQRALQLLRMKLTPEMFTWFLMLTLALLK
ncbi:RNA polymerase sigma-70 factor [Mucilaginibacter sabulilitoris]|uniref:RNA polymerase sigma-70 factor n=1 Tax=Mucilaginibacter sabulilitoris TaxID=1173583 RepID=A0ABZ0TG87_9SPHI|nr:RNA polymerase sigma-70 factor [Mucilaginibacter sabulilitoris]WPU92023.1 RNA polymerase sigma-70 factor [Mucilaginibacter sabulilitoris]